MNMSSHCILTSGDGCVWSDALGACYLTTAHDADARCPWTTRQELPLLASWNKRAVAANDESPDTVSLAYPVLFCNTRI